ncbi:MAG TPA: DUF2249 domain-containing protein [Microbacteriaceae bacterium]|nr:DUF2249 domain-containing protein [Microbacteriaceae bacterium]
MPKDREIDVRSVPRPERHPLVFAAFAQLEAGQAITLVNDHEPLHLREEFEHELPGAFRWEPIGAGTDGAFLTRIVRVTRTPLPRVLGDTAALPEAIGSDGAGSVWQLAPAERDLDANVIELPAGDEIAAHDGPDLDVLVHVLAGAGTLETELGTIELAPGSLVWLPRRARRRFLAGPDGLRYFSVHRRKPALSITTAPPRP